METHKAITHPFDLKVAYPTILLTIFSWLIIIVTCLLTVQGRMPYGWAIAINAIFAYVLFTPMHEAGHLNVSANKKSLRWLDEMIGWVSGLALLAPFYIFKVIHFRHHAHTNHPEKDPDHWLASKNVFSLFFHSATIFPLYLIKAIQLLFSKEKLAKKVKKDIRIGLIGFVVILMLVISFGYVVGWKWLLILWAIPALLAQIFLAFAFDWLPHHPHEKTARYLNTRVFNIPGLSFFLLGQNYHLIHHLYPRIPFYDYKKVFEELEEDLKEKEVNIIELG